VRDSRLSNSIVQQSASVLNAVIANSMVGNHATVTGNPNDLSLGDYNQLRV
jgi:glucose-1-phosphate thymidylyltransferase